MIDGISAIIRDESDQKRAELRKKKKMVPQLPLEAFDPILDGVDLYQIYGVTEIKVSKNSGSRYLRIVNVNEF